MVIWVDAGMHQIMNNMLTSFEQYAQAYLGPNRFRPQHRPCRLGNPAPRGKLNAARLLLMISIFSADVADTTPLARYVPQWDTDSVIIGIDHRCSGCMSHETADFTGDLNGTRVIHGFRGTRYYNI